MATIDRPRIVRCPRCLALLQEPPPGTPLYKCGNCSTVLRAKHAANEGSGARRVSERPQRPNRSNPAAHLESVDARSLRAKRTPPDHMSTPANLNDHNDIRSGTGMSRPTAVAARRDSPSYPVQHGNPGSEPTTRVPNNMYANHENGHRLAHENRRLSPPNPLAVRRNKDDDVRSREAPENVPQTKAFSSVDEDYNSGRGPSSHVHHKNRSPPGAVPVNPPVLGDLTGERKGRTHLLSQNAVTNVNTNTRLETSPTDLTVEGASSKPHPANMPSESSNYREKEKHEEPDEEGDGDFSPTKALAAIQNAGPLYKVRERQQLGLGLKSGFSPRGSLGGRNSRGRNKSLGDECLGGSHADLVHDRNRDSGPSFQRPSEENPGWHRRQSSDSVAIISLGKDIFIGHPGLHTIRRKGLEDQITGIDESSKEGSNVRLLSPNMTRDIQSAGVAMDKQKSRDHSPSDGVREVPEVCGRNSTARPSSSDVIGQLNGTNNELSIPSEQGPSSVGEKSLVQWRQQKDTGQQEFPKEKLVIERDHSDDELKAGQSLRTDRTHLSPPRNLAVSSPASFSKTSFGGVQPYPEHLSKAKDRSRQVSDTPLIKLDVFGLPDVLDYDTSDDSSNLDDADPYPINSKLHFEEFNPPALSHKREMGQVVEVGGDSGRLDYREKQDLAETRSDSSSEERLNDTGKFGPVVSSGSPLSSPHLSPGSVHSASQFQAHDQREQPVQENFNGPSDSLNSVGFGEENAKGSAYSLQKGQSQTIRLQINFLVPVRIHVRCCHCKLQLEVPLNLPPSESGVQKLRCGSCWKISRFRLNHLLEPCGGSSPAVSDNSAESSFRLDSNSSDGLSGGYSGTRSNRETGSQDRLVIRTQSGASLPVPPSGRHNPRAASGSKLVNMILGSNLPSETSKASSPNNSGDLGPSERTMQIAKETVDLPPSTETELVHTSLSPTLSSTSQDVGTSRQQKISPDHKLLQSSSDSDEEKASAHLKIGPSPVPTPMCAWPLDTPDFDDGQEFKGIKGFFKKSVKELTKGKKSNQYRRKVVVNGHSLPDDVVKKAEEYAGFIHPGHYWYDIRAGFWGVMGGPCLGMIPPFIEELNFTLSRHCSQGKTGVLVNGRELHHKDLELLKKRGLPGTPGKSYNVDIDGRLTEAETGVELKGLGRLAPTLEQTGRGPGMWVPESQRVS